ncbi:hypothetical protein [Hoeflea alexandrii]
MNTQMTRRAAMGAIAAAAIPISADAGSDVSGPSKMAQLIADFRAADDQQYQAWWKCEELEIALDMPELRVSGGQFRKGGDIWLHSPGEVDRHFAGQVSNVMPANVIEAGKVRRAQAHAKLNTLAADRRRLREESGLAAAEAAADAAEDRLHAASEALFAYVPVTIDEYRERDAFMLELISGGYDFDSRRLEALFSS